MRQGRFTTGSPDGRSGMWGITDVLKGLPFVSIQASGGSVEDIVINNILYKQHTFNSVGQSTFSISSLGSNPGTEIEIEMVGAGGGGGTGNGQWAFGGGGGGYLKAKIVPQVIDYTINVGSYGVEQTACNNSTWSNSGKGGNSSFSTLVAGGGYGGSSANSADGNTSIGGTNTTTGASSVIANYSGGNGGKTSGDYNNFGGSNGLYSQTQDSTYGSGPAGVPNFTAGPFASGYGNGGSGAPSCQNGHRGGGRGSQGIVIVRYPIQEIR